MKCDYCSLSNTFPYRAKAPIETKETNPSWYSYKETKAGFGIHFCPIDYCENSIENYKVKNVSAIKIKQELN
jgi:hypothetical protein